MPDGRLAENHTSAYALPEPDTPVDTIDTLQDAWACPLAGKRMPKQPTANTRRRAETRVIGTSTADRIGRSIRTEIGRETFRG
jgi:hypothetical protein